MKSFLPLILIVAFTGVMLYASMELPYRGNPESPMTREQSITGTEVPGHYYIEHAYEDAHTPNMVTVVLGDYRSLDTLGEQVVVFTAGLICFLLLRKRKEES